jgi:hypothetical protein
MIRGKVKRSAVGDKSSGFPNLGRDDHYTPSPSTPSDHTPRFRSLQVPKATIRIRAHQSHLIRSAVIQIISRFIVYYVWCSILVITYELHINRELKIERRWMLNSAYITLGLLLMFEIFDHTIKHKIGKAPLYLRLPAQAPRLNLVKSIIQGFKNLTIGSEVCDTIFCCAGVDDGPLNEVFERVQKRAFDDYSLVNPEAKIVKTYITPELIGQIQMILSKGHKVGLFYFGHGDMRMTQGDKSTSYEQNIHHLSLPLLQGVGFEGTLVTYEDILWRFVHKPNFVGLVLSCGGCLDSGTGNHKMDVSDKMNRMNLDNKCLITSSSPGIMVRVSEAWNLTSRCEHPKVSQITDDSDQTNSNICLIVTKAHNECKTVRFIIRPKESEYFIII